MRKIGLGLFLGLLLAVMAPFARADQVALRAALHDGFARIALDWPAPIAFEARADDHTLTIEFKRPLEAPVAQLARELRPYIVAATLKDGGKTLVARLARPVTLKTFTTHDKTVVVDLIEAKARPESPPRPRPEPKSPPKPGLETVHLSAARSASGTRVRMQWPRKVAFDFHIKDGKARLSVRAAGALDERALAAMLPDFAPTVEQHGSTTAVAFTLPPGATLKAIRFGDAILLEASATKAKPEEIAPAPPAPETRTAAASDAPAPVAHEVTPGTTRAAAGLEAASQAPAVAPPPPIARPTSPAATGSSPAQAKAVAAPATPGPAPAKVAVHLAAADPGVSLRFDWPVATAAAVFRRGGSLWIIFAMPTTLDLADVIRNGASYFASVEPVALEHAAALRIVTRSGLEPNVRRAGTAWIIDLKSQPTSLDAPIAASAHPDASPASVSFRVDGAAAPIRLADAEIGPLIVVPVAELGRGVTKPSDFVDFRTLPTTQGLVLEPFSDNLAVHSGVDGVEVTRPGGLELSSEQDRLMGRRPTSLLRLFDFSGWLGPKGVDYVDERARLEAAVAAAPAPARTVPRLALARFYFAHLFAAETLGVLDAIGRDDPKRLDDPPVAALKGAACVLVGDLKCAGDALGAHTLDNELEVGLWRAALASARGDEAAAAKGFLRSASLLPLYPRALRARFALEAARAMLATDRASSAGPLLDLVLNDRATIANRARALYLDGMRLKAVGRVTDALARWDQAIKSGDPKAAAEARVAKALALLDTGKLSRADAIKTLDSERFAWRGGDFEFTLLRKLGELELAQGDEEAGLDALHAAAVYFPNEPAEKDVVKETSDAFAALFLDGKSSDLPPLKALALYDEFHDLEPSGERHDAIVKQLIDRLVAVDLLDRAATLLDEQVREDLTGPEKARGATQLALLRLMNHQPDRALAALDIDVGQNVSPDLARQRQQLRARVMMELGKSADALNLIAGDQSRDADRLRADIYWRSRDWKNAALTLARLAGPPPTDGKIGANEARVVIGLAAALTLGDDQAGLARVRAAFGSAMAKSSYAAAFRVLAGDGTTPPSGDPEAIAVHVAQIGALQDFMSMYKAKLASADAPTAIR